MSGHFGELAAELLPEAEAAADAVQDAIDVLQLARQRWAAVASRFDALMREVPGVRGLADPMPHLRLGGLDDVLAPVDGEVPLPAPRVPAHMLPEGAPVALRAEPQEEEEDDVKEAV
jgi:hypothetical protein